MTKPPTPLCATLIAVFLVLTVSVTAQTGSFDITLPFAGGQRTVACYVPPDYDSTKTYGLLVGLHGKGHNGIDYRNVRISSAGWQSIFPNTIFMFPDGGEDQGKDFYAPAGDEAFIGVTLDYARSKYSIDSSNVLLQGFSLGGRSALKYGSKYPHLFKGLLLNTPAIQGIADLENDPAQAPPFMFDGAATIPVFVTVGLDDDGAYIDAIRLMVKKLRSRSGAVQHVEVAGMGHSIVPNSITSVAKTFITTKTQKVYDLILFDVQTSKHTTSTDVLARASVQNLGGQPIPEIEVTFSIGGKTMTAIASGPFAPNQTVVLEALITDVPPGGQTLRATVQNLSPNQTDPNASNNTNSFYTVVRGERGTTNATEGFESLPRWTIDTSGNAFAWIVDPSVGRSSTTSLFAYNTILVFYTQGLSESVTSPFIDISGLSNKSFSFDYTYNYHRYTAAVLGVDRDFADTLVVEASTNSGATYTTLFRKAAAALATFNTPILNPTALNQCYAEPAASNWRHVVLPLHDFANEKNLLIRMRYVSGHGGFINIDNLAFGADAVSVEDDNAVAGPNADIISISPNPASDNVTFRLNNVAATDDRITDVRLYNSAGEEVLHHIANDVTVSTVAVALTSLPAGIYTATITSGMQNYVRAVAIVR